LLLSIFGLWCALGSHLGIIKGDEQNFYLEIIGVCLFIPFFWFFLYSFTKIIVTDEYISRKDFLFRERKMYFSDIKRYKTSLFQNEKFLILYSDNFELKLPLYDRNFVVDFSKVLRKLFCEKIENSIQNIKENGILFESFKYKIIINGKGIKNLKTNKEFLWNEIDCKIKSKETYTIYTFEIDIKFNVIIYNVYLKFAYEDFFNEMVKKCRTCII
jgi:hypothetical protein